ncbi:unnamed protein product [Closterium sp. Yama58-4]|nr:unnamed protein product [Closterium sp. Yama58-4]
MASPCKNLDVDATITSDHVDDGRNDRMSDMSAEIYQNSGAILRMPFTGSTRSSLGCSGNEFSISDSRSLDELPSDVLLIVFSFFSRETLATAALVSRKWRHLASTDSLSEDLLRSEDPEGWPMVVFAETQLRLGRGSSLGSKMPNAPTPRNTLHLLCCSSCAIAPPVPTLLRAPSRPNGGETLGRASGKMRCQERQQMVQRQCGGSRSANGLPWSAIYRLRAQLPPAVVVDGGSGYCKFGMSSEAAPSGRIATFLEFGNIEAPSLGRLRALFSSIYASMRAIPANHPVVVSEPLAFLPETHEAQEGRRNLREATCAVLFSALRVPSICLVDQATLALFAAGAASGVVVNIGFRSTTILPIMRGRTACDLLPFYCLPLGAMRVTGHLSQLLHEAGIVCQSMFTVRTIKEVSVVSIALYQSPFAACRWVPCLPCVCTIKEVRGLGMLLKAPI